jgi:hypothetical protein
MFILAKIFPQAEYNRPVQQLSTGYVVDRGLQVILFKLKYSIGLPGSTAGSAQFILDMKRLPGIQFCTCRAAGRGTSQAGMAPMPEDDVSYSGRE